MKRNSKGFTLIELLVVIAIISMLSAVVAASLTSVRKKARDSQRIQNARQISHALELYEQTNNTYKVASAGLNANPGNGYVAKGSETSGYTTSILSSLKTSGFYNSLTLRDPVYGTDNYYLGVCTSTNAYNVFLKVEQDELKQSSTTISAACDGITANSLGFNYVSSTVGGNSGGLAEAVSGGGGGGFTCGVTTVIGQDELTYGTVVGADSRCWLDRNLGATRVANAYNDYEAHGDLYQWGRVRDGHELITHTGIASAFGVNGSTTTLSSIDAPPDSLFIRGTGNWRSPQNNNLWQGVDGVNNPCPADFRVPTQPEWATLVASSTITNSATAFSSVLKLPTAGFRNYTSAAVGNLGAGGNYWSSSPNGVYAYILNFTLSSSDPLYYSYRANGFTLRCIKD